MAQHPQLGASCRVALAAMLHDVGKLAERARLDIESDTLMANKHLYCPFHADKGYFSHVHAAYTGIAVDAMTPWLPNLTGQDLTPFADWRSQDADDSLINAAAMHHKPVTFLQWIIATADRVASGFERESFEQYNQTQDDNHYRSRLLSLMEQIDLQPEQQKQDSAPLAYRYPLKPLSVASLFPQPTEQCVPATNEEAQSQYRALWQALEQGLAAIPESHRSCLPLWLDHFDSLWLSVGHAIPSATAFGAKPDVSLYDHSKTTAALATALWRYHADRQDDEATAREAMASRSDWDENKFLLIQGDFFGIQSFIFAGGSQSNRKATKLLRGRSFYVSLLTECAALKILETLGLPATSQITNAAGKFLIVAPNTQAVHEQLAQLQDEFDHWFLNHSYGQSGIGLAMVPASCGDFGAGQGNQRPFRQLITRLFTQLETAKYQRFGLCGETPAPAIFTDYLDSIDPDKGVCAVDGRQPGETLLTEGHWISALAEDQIRIGSYLARPDKQRLLLTSNPVHSTLTLPLFGYYANFTGPEQASGKFGPLARDGVLQRAFDICLPASEEQGLFHGYARRFINAHVPTWDEQADWESAKYRQLDTTEPCTAGDLKTFEHLACEDRQPDKQGKRWNGIRALHTLKGDVDNLGAVFEAGLRAPTFAKMATLSRQVNLFFAVWLPWYCANHSDYRNLYTVFAGGDDFFLIGPWRSSLALSAQMAKAFEHYVSFNPQLHFSAGLVQCKPGLPVSALAHQGEAALEQAKAHEGKNAVTVYGRTVPWSRLNELLTHTQRLTELRHTLSLSTGLLYGLIELCDMAGRESREPQAARWRAYLSYRIARYVSDKLAKRQNETASHYDERKRRLTTELVTELGQAISTYREDFKIALFSHLYQLRD